MVFGCCWSDEERVRILISSEAESLVGALVDSSRASFLTSSVDLVVSEGVVVVFWLS